MKHDPILAMMLAALRLAAITQKMEDKRPTPRPQEFRVEVKEIHPLDLPVDIQRILLERCYRMPAAAGR